MTLIGCLIYSKIVLVTDDCCFVLLASIDGSFLILGLGMMLIPSLSLPLATDIVSVLVGKAGNSSISFSP